ncbi:hypothetical protein BJ875DRAFT_17987 [Amylocarpus encephaloides]|uniref:LIM zinc-binding domain-containing protein n=1 Tax=Amylocarpus encephaloides TaxID=45428 RepID=A0A9P7YJH5_9HELO|nr:hypothetical protein BJ875DRAFT_17987 [Amylocarpus encephaloides]
MATANRQSGFLPTIKCSMCSKDIEIANLGDHVCGAAGEPTPPPDSSARFDQFPHKGSLTTSPEYSKPSRMVPPKVDTLAANRPYFPQDELTPMSASPSIYTSSVDGLNSPFGQPLRSATAPVRPAPSPEFFSSNIDSSFPPFPSPKGLRPQQARRLGEKYAEADPMYAPVSPRMVSSGGLLQRMNTIAPGPFDIDRRKKAQETSKVRGHPRQDTEGSIKDIASASYYEVGSSISLPSTAGPGHSRTSTDSSDGSNSEFLAKAPRKNGYDGFGPPHLEEPSRMENRSQTFPLESPSLEPLRRPSEPRVNPRVRDLASERRKPSMSGPDLSRPLPPRGASLIRPRIDTTTGEVPPLPNLDAEFGVSNPYHTPTESQSSDSSNFSEESAASSRSSPPGSVKADQSRRKPSDTTQIVNLMSDLQSSLSNPSPKKPSPKTSPVKRPGLQPRGLGLPARPSSVGNKEQFARPLLPPPKLKSSMLSPESPMDPAIQNGRLSPIPPNTTQNSSRSNSADRQERRPSSSKGNCKGCGDAIKGKSISSADGRLTGRYHKHCFVCKTCSEPFQTATFYVINDAPYCERHYHKLNGSTCTTCDKGIEGQYLESERKQKFHPGCLACADCKRLLKRDYFEMNGRVFCERDAWRRAQQPKFLGAAGGNKMERRTTRLMRM